MAETRSPALSIVVVAVVVAVAIVGPLGGRENTGETESFSFVAKDHSIGEGVVVEKAERGGFSLLGFDISQPQRYARVAFTLPRSCVLDGAVDWPVPGADCAGPEGLTGYIAGSGVTAAGGPIVLVESVVDVDCFSRIELGATWPPAACETL